MIPPEAQPCPAQPQCPPQQQCPPQKACPTCPTCNTTVASAPAQEKIVYLTTEIHHVSFKKCCNCTAAAAILPVVPPVEVRAPVTVEPVTVQPAAIEPTTVEPVKLAPVT